LERFHCIPQISICQNIFQKNFSPGHILNILLNFRKFQPQYSYIKAGGRKVSHLKRGLVNGVINVGERLRNRIIHTVKVENPVRTAVSVLRHGKNSMFLKLYSRIQNKALAKISDEIYRQTNPSFALSSLHYKLKRSAITRKKVSMHDKCFCRHRRISIT